MGTWICTNCNYKFNSKKCSDCPYCGKESVEKEKNATELLKEVDKLLKE